MNVGLLSSVSALALVGYVGAVIAHGNLNALVEQVSKDWRFIEVPIALGVIYALMKVDVLREPVAMLLGVAVLAVALKVASDGQTTAVLTQFGNGTKSIFDVFSTIGSKL